MQLRCAPLNARISNGVCIKKLYGFHFLLKMDKIYKIYETLTVSAYFIKNFVIMLMIITYYLQRIFYNTGP